MKTRSLILCALFLFSALPSLANAGLIKIKSQFGVNETVLRFSEAVTKNGLKIFYTMSHDQEATTVNKNLRPTQLIIFGSPMVGTALMQCNQTAGIDLPLKALVWQDQNNDVYLAYNNVKSIESRHGLSQCDLPLDKIALNIKTLAIAATQK